MPLDQEQQIFLEQLIEDIKLYQDELETQIRTTKILSYVGIGVSITVAIIYFKEPAFVTAIKELSENMDYITGLIGEVIPVALASKSYNSMTNQKKKLKGLRKFDKTIQRMQLGLIPNSKADILLLEDDFAEYVIQ